MVGNFKPSALTQSPLCAEQPPPNCGMVLFGASGDLAKKKILPALADLFKRGLLGDSFFCIGCGRKNYSDKDFQTIIAASEKISASLTDGQLKEFLKRFYYVSGDYKDEHFYNEIAGRFNKIANHAKKTMVKIFYLSLPPFLYPDVVENIGKSNLAKGSADNIRIVIEKPFGRDQKTALELNEHLSKWFDEKQIYRIDHYLGKETVQNILMFRFANTIFEPIWNRNYVDHVQITIAESVGINSRGGYYDSSGAIRDMFQNHMLNMVSLVAMEPPASFKAEHIRNEKVQLLQSLREFSIEPWANDIVTGQYAAGKIEDKEVCGYRQEDDVDDRSITETYVAARLFVDNWRWQDVPFYLRTGKRLASSVTEIAIVFKKVPHVMFKTAGIEQLPSNVLILKIQPHEGISLYLEAKRPGAKLCIGTLAMDFNYAEVFGISPPDAYQRLLLDCMNGDQTLFTRIDEVKLAWGLIDRIVAGNEPESYPAGAESFSLADGLIQKDGRSWRKISDM